MNKKAKLLNKQNNELDELIKDENQKVFTDIICYLRNSDLSDYNTEAVRNDITNMIIDAQKRGDSIDEVIGEDYKEFCDSIIATFPRKMPFEKMLEIIDLFCICISIIMLIFMFLSQNTIDIIRNLATNQAVDLTYTVTLGTIIGFVSIIIFSIFIVKMILNNIFEGNDKKEHLVAVASFVVTVGLLIVSVFLRTPLFDVSFVAILAVVILLFGVHLIIDRVIE
ncbi:MAG: hypothetical protein K6B15_10385 [Parasporobacterium sp.]|nr:hypothetical protein [Parasporobacterium sp.]